VGVPALSLVGESLDVAVLEVSSFQLETTEAFRPKVAVVLNVAPDHLDRHGNFEAYAAAKRRIVERQTAEDCAVLNWGDPTVREMARATSARVVPFQRRPSAPLTPPCAWLDGSSAVLQMETGTLRLPLDGLSLAGSHNLENALAALTAVQAVGADPVAACAALTDFRGLPHRCEVVGGFAGVTYVDDSKATNVSAAERALQGFDSPVVWIAGGRDKGLPFSELADVAERRVRHAVLIGEAAPLLERALAGRVDCERADSLCDAVRAAARSANAGDVVLLAPACASFDQFDSYEQRGDCFRAAVEALGQEGRP
jgi:UDP-N-acetylmuramoylalanine--D-glutamate ligase